MVIKNIKNTIEWLNSLDKDTLEGWMQVIIFFIVIDVFGIYWWLGMKKIGSAMILVSIIFLAVILALMRKFPSDKKQEKEVKKMTELNDEPKNATDQPIKEKAKEMEKNLDEESEDSIFGGLDIGMPDADEYQKRLNKAIGSDFNFD